MISEGCPCSFCRQSHSRVADQRLYLRSEAFLVVFLAPVVIGRGKSCKAASQACFMFASSMRFTAQGSS